MARRKTIQVQELFITVNQRILNEPTKEGRKALGLLLSSVLMDTGHYGGFGYVHKDGSSIWKEEFDQLKEAGTLDETLIQYFYKP